MNKEDDELLAHICQTVPFFWRKGNESGVTSLGFVTAPKGFCCCGDVLTKFDVLIESLCRRVDQMCCADVLIILLCRRVDRVCCADMLIKFVV